MEPRVTGLYVGLISVLIMFGGCERLQSEAVRSDTIHAGLLWSLRLEDVGTTLLLTDASGASVLSISCREEPRTMTIDVEKFQPVSSEDRMSVGAGDEAFVFVADLADTTTSGVRAHAPTSEMFLEHFQRATQISASYGAQTVGPHMPPDPSDTKRFVGACGRN
ncbi:hypothetical protein BH23GEM6_BH23GEM6_24520 [soil metagenome]